MREQSAYLSDLFRFEDEADGLIAQSTNARNGRIQPTPVIHPQATQRPKGLPSSGGMHVVADRIGFHYPGSDRAILHEVSLAIEPGERIAIVGKNGAGKSTLVRLLIGLYAPTSGSVRLDGVDTNDHAAAPRRTEIGAVFQDFIDYQLTARENIAVGDLSRVDDDGALDQAVRQAEILGLIDALPDRYDSYLGRSFGERDLSGGEWQRIALARAFFRRSRFLVLDEPTAALDPIAEQAIFERFAELAAGSTTLMVSHRLGPARFADRIILMENGRIIEQGRHDDLIAAGGGYAEMYAAQAAWYR